MNSFWLKIAVFVVIVIGLILAVTIFLPAKDQKPKEPPKTIYDMAEKDRKEILAKPSAADFQQQSPQQPESTEVVEVPQVPAKPAEPLVLYFTDVSEIDKFEADKLLVNLPKARTLGRLPMTGYSLMIQSCRQLMGKWPGSIYDYQARRALSKMPERFWARYKINDELVNLDYFKTQRPGTKPYEIKEEN